MKNKFISATLLASAIALAGTAIANAEMVFTGEYGYYLDDNYGGKVLKIGYRGPGSGTLEKGKTWTMSENVLIGCCPNNIEPTYLHIYGTANIMKDVYVSGISRSGHCYVDGGTWNCAGAFNLGIEIAGTVTVQNGGKLSVGDEFTVAHGATVTVTDSSTLKLSFDNSDGQGVSGGFQVRSGGNPCAITLSSAKNLIVDATQYSNNADQFILENFIVADSNNGATLNSLRLTVGDGIFMANNEESLNQYLGGITVEGFENYTKSFVVNAETQSVSLHLSKIPEPSAFGLLAGIGALALVASRRHRR